MEYQYITQFSSSFNFTNFCCHPPLFPSPLYNTFSASSLAAISTIKIPKYTSLIFFPIISSTVWQIITIQKGSPMTDQDLQAGNEDRIYFQLMEKVGAKHNYQKITLVFWSICTYLCGGIALISPFLVYQDSYVCPTSYGTLNCDEYVCSLKDGRENYISASSSIHSLTDRFGDFRCEEEQTYLSLLLLVAYAGIPVGFFLTSILGGSIGRKAMMLACNLLTLLGLLLIICSVHMVMAAIGLFLSLMGGMLGFNYALSYITETVDEDKRERYSIVAQLFYGVGALGNVGTFYAIGDWLYILIFFYLVPVVIVILGIIFLAVDTPICLITKNTPEVAHEAFMHIARINNVSELNLTVEDVAKVKQLSKELEDDDKNHKKFTVLDLFRYKSVKKTTVCLMIVDCSIALLFYAPGLMIDQFQLNIFINGLSVSASEFIAYPIAFLLITRMNRKTMAYICFTTCLICAIVLTVIWQPRINGASEKIQQDIAVFVLVFLFRFAITLQYTFYCVYSNQVYPTQVRSIGWNFNTMIGGTVITFSPYLIQLSLSYGFKIMIIFAVMAFLSIIAYCNLPETLSIPPPDIIEELTARATEKNIPMTISFNKSMSNDELSNTITISNG